MKTGEKPQPIKTFHRGNIHSVMALIMSTLTDLGKEHGFSVAQDGGGRFTPEQIRMKLHFNLTNAAPRAAKAVDKFPAGYPLTDDDIGLTVNYSNGTFRIEGYDPAPRIQKRVVLSKDGASGYRVTPNEVLVMLGRARDNESGGYPGDWSFHPGESFDTYHARTEALLNAIPQDKIIGFPVGDGKALYYVQSMRPLRLQHIPYGDAYRISAAHLRGLRLADVERMMLQNQAIVALFSRKTETEAPTPAARGKTRKNKVA